MPATFGVHIGPQNIGMNDLRALWRKLDHFETLTALGALAADTKNARLGVLVLYVGYRMPGVLAKAATCSPVRRSLSVSVPRFASPGPTSTTHGTARESA